jgi:hypothetical protein
VRVAPPSTEIAMHLDARTLRQLFAQLGLPDEQAAIDAFILSHSPLPGHVRLPDAPFWTTAQSQLLRAGVADDAEWAAVVDTLDSMLRH